MSGRRKKMDMYKVPEDVLVTIFEIAATDDCHEQMASYFNASKTPAHLNRRPKRPLQNSYKVCRLWQDVIKAIPRLWVLPLAVSVGHAQLMPWRSRSRRAQATLEHQRGPLAASKGCDIHLHVDFPEIGTWSDQSGKVEKELKIVQDTFELLAPYFVQLQIVIVNGLTPAMMEFFRNGLQSLGPSSRLAYFALRLARTHDDHEVADHDPYFERIVSSPFAFKNQNLSFLKLEGMQFTLDDSLDLPGLHGAELSLHLLSWDSLSYFLSASPIMQYFGANFYSVPVDPPSHLAPLLMPDLKEIQLTACVCDALILLKMLQLPRLRSLNINARLSEDADISWALGMDEKSRSLPALSELSLRGRASKAELARFFYACSMPHIRYVNITELRATNVVLPHDVIHIPIALDISLNRLVPHPTSALNVIHFLDLPHAQRLKIHFRSTMTGQIFHDMPLPILSWPNLQDLHLSSIRTQKLFSELMPVFSASSIRNLTVGFISSWEEIDPVGTPDQIVDLPSIVSLTFTDTMTITGCTRTFSLISVPGLRELNMDQVQKVTARQLETFCAKHSAMLQYVQSFRLAAPSEARDWQIKSYIPALLSVKNLVLGFESIGLESLIVFLKPHYGMKQQPDSDAKFIAFPELETLALQGFKPDPSYLPIVTSLIRELVHFRASVGKRLKKLYIKVDSEFAYETTIYLSERVDDFRYFLNEVDEGKWKRMVLQEKENFVADESLHFGSPRFWK